MQVTITDDLIAALSEAVRVQMEAGMITLIEADLNHELGAPFRGAMKKPAKVARIELADMAQQTLAG